VRIAFRLCGFDHPVGNRPDLAIRLALADHEVVGDGGLIADVDHDRVPGFLLGCGAPQQTGQLKWRESPGPFSSQPNDYEESVEGIGDGALAPMQRICVVGSCATRSRIHDAFAALLVAS